MIVHSLVSALGLMASEFSSARKLRVITPRKATYKDLAVYHTRDYLDFVLDPSKSDGVETDSVAADTEFGLEDVLVH